MRALPFSSVFRVFLGFAMLLGLPAMLSGCASTEKGDRPATLGKEDGEAASLRLAERALAQGDLQLAASLLTEAHRKEPQRPDILVALGDVLLRVGDGRAAGQAFRDALAIDGGNAMARRGLGRSLLQLGQPEPAIAEFERAVAAAPQDARNYNGLGVALDQAGRNGEAQASYRRGLSQKPADAALTNNLGLSLLLSGDAAGAVAVLEPLGKAVTATARQRQNLALAYGLSGRDREAAAMAALDLEPAAVQQNLAFYRRLRADRGAGKTATLDTALPPPTDFSGEGPAVIPTPRKPVDIAALTDGPVIIAHTQTVTEPLGKNEAKTEGKAETKAETKVETKAEKIGALPNKEPAEKEATHQAEPVKTPAAKEVPPPTSPAPANTAAAATAPKAEIVTEAASKRAAPLVQMGAWRDADAAKDALRTLEREHPALFAGLSAEPFVLELPSGARYVRLRLTGFKEGAAAKALCDAMIGKNIGCFVIGAP